MLFVLRLQVLVQRLGRPVCSELNWEIGNVRLTLMEEPQGARRSQTEAEGGISGAAGGTDGDAGEIWTKLLTGLSF